MIETATVTGVLTDTMHQIDALERAGSPHQSARYDSHPTTR